MYHPDFSKRPEPPTGLLDPTKWPWLIGAIWLLGVAFGEWASHRPPHELPKEPPAQTGAHPHRD